MRGRVAEEIKARLTMPQVAGFYGYEPNRSGFLQCPFHSGDRQASLKIYPDGGGWHCFGCGKGGSVIDFVMELFDLTFPQACIRLNRDFSLGLPMGGERMSYQEQRRMEEAAKTRREELEAQKREREAEDRRELALIQSYQYFWELSRILRPMGPNSISPLYEIAVKKLPYLEYQIDEMADRRWCQWEKKQQTT